MTGVVFRSDKGGEGEDTGHVFAQACKAIGVTQSMVRVGSALDNATSESWNSTLEFELLSRRRFATKDQARQEVAAFIDRYNTTRRHSTCEMRSPVHFEAILAARAHTACPTPRRLHTKIRLLTRVAFGFHGHQPLIALALLALGSHPPRLPGR